jgi:hypothetical protein
LIVPTFPAPIGTVVSEVILPEGAVILNVEIPVTANITRYEEVQNLDIRGRPVVHIETQNLASTDRIPITIQYALHASANFVKIGLLAFGFCVVFAPITIARRIDLGINIQTKVENE